MHVYTRNRSDANFVYKKKACTRASCAQFRTAGREGKGRGIPDPDAWRMLVAGERQGRTKGRCCSPSRQPLGQIGGVAEK
jgi:hypothetical protein